MTPDIQLPALYGTSWSLATLEEYFSDVAHFALLLQANGEEVRKRMAELFSTLSSSVQSFVSFPPRGLNEEQIQRIFTVAQNAELFSFHQLVQPNGHLFFDNFLEACQRKPALAVAFIQSGLPVSEEGFERIFEKNQKEAVEAILDARVALAPHVLKKLILYACRTQSTSTIQTLNSRKLSSKYWEYGLQQCCLTGDQRAASFLLQNVPFSLPPLFHALILGNNAEVIRLMSLLSPEEKRGAFIERFPLTNQVIPELTRVFKNEEILSFLTQQSLMPLTISDGKERRVTVSISYFHVRSDILQDMLLESGELIEENFDAFLNILAYLHTGKLQKEEADFEALFTVADKYGFRGINFQEWLDELPGFYPDRKKRVDALNTSSYQPPQIVFEQEENPLADPYTEEDLLRKYSAGQKLLKEEFVKACSKGWVGFLKCALTKEWIQQFDDAGEPLLLIAWEKDNLELFRLLLKRGASPVLQVNGGTYLHDLASVEIDTDESVPFMRALLAAIPRWRWKEFISQENEDGETALALAATKPTSVGPLQVLLEAGADPMSAVDELHEMASWTEHYSQLSCLLKFIPPDKLRNCVNRQDDKGNTPLHSRFLNPDDWFGTNGDIEFNTVEILLNAGADLFIKNEAGMTPLALAFTCGEYNTHAAIPMFRLLSPEQKQRLSDFAATLYPDDGRRDEDTPMHALCKNGRFTYEESMEDQTQMETMAPAMASQRNQEGLLPLQIAILNGATHLIGLICGDEKLDRFAEFVKQL